MLEPTTRRGLFGMFGKAVGTAIAATAIVSTVTEDAEADWDRNEFTLQPPPPDEIMTPDEIKAAQGLPYSKVVILEKLPSTANHTHQIDHNHHHHSVTVDQWGNHTHNHSATPTWCLNCSMPEGSLIHYILPEDETVPAGWKLFEGCN